VHKRGLCSREVSVCSSVCLFVTFVYSVKTNTRPNIDLEAWQRQDFRPLGSSNFSNLVLLTIAIICFCQCLQVCDK